MQIRTPADAEVVLREYVRRKAKPPARRFVARKSWRFLRGLNSGLQQNLLRSKSKRLAALCSRRAGKSFLGAAMLLQAAGDHPDGFCAYLATTREQARRIMWKELKRFNRDFALGVKFNETKMIARLRNGAEIACLGALNEKDVDRLRGSAFVLVVIDEAASFPVRGAGRRHDIKKAAASQQSEEEKQREAARERAKRLEKDLLYRLWREVLSPAMLDYQGRVLMLGTPAAHCSGYFFEITQPDKKRRVRGWDVFEWTVLDNPHVPKVKEPGGPQTAFEWLAQMRLEEGIDEKDPAYQREWLGRWVHSADSLVYYSFKEAKNTYGEEEPEILDGGEADGRARPGGTAGGEKRRVVRDWLPADVFEGLPLTPQQIRKHDWFFGISVDLGYDDPTVIGLFMWSDTRPDVYLVACMKNAKLIPSRIAAEIKRVEKHEQIGALSFVVVDHGGGSGKIFSAEMMERWSIPSEGAKKTEKPVYVELCNGDMATGRFKIHKRCLPVLEEISVLQWDPRYPGRKEDPRFANDACDMMLYGWREAKHHVHGKTDDPKEIPDESLPEPGSEEYNAAVEDEMERKLERRVQREVAEDRRRALGQDDGEGW